MIKARGFTIIEVVVVVVVLGILATLATIGVQAILVNGRDSHRSANVTAITSALDKYYEKNGEYPGCGAMTASAETIALNTLKGIDESAFLVPGADESIDNYIQCAPALTMDGDDYYQYVGTGGVNCSTTGWCAGYTIFFRDEAKDQVVSVSSRYN